GRFHESIGSRPERDQTVASRRVPAAGRTAAGGGDSGARTGPAGFGFAGGAGKYHGPAALKRARLAIPVFAKTILNFGSSGGSVPEENASPFRAVAMGPNLPRMLQGGTGAIAIPDLRQFKVQPQSAAMANVAEGGFEAMYSQTVDHALHGTGAETFEAIDMLRKIDTAKYPPENGAEYPKSAVGQRLQQIGVMIKANIGAEVLFLDCGGWDNHVNEGGAQGQLSNLLKDLGQSLAAFHRDMGDRMGDIIVVTMSEFGRTAKENGNRGTDHGHANCMFVMGGDVKGGHVYGKWPGVNDHQLNDGRDLALTTDFRTVVGEILTKHLGVKNLSPVFPGFDSSPHKFVGLVRS
ncbi:MAG TPA: DUF1501 domain-containing protein, partial [Candidatus Acidoferrum sp.]|nr:DUF1501 domain-containing protein [Candidatus Acidoferrum sp.]